MSAERAEPETAPEELVEDAELVDGVAIDDLPIVATVQPLDRRRPQALPAMQAAAAATTGFLAGAATVALVQRFKVAQRQRAPQRAADLLPIAGTRSFLVDIHLIGRE